jgi:uncharacterized protein YggE
MSVNNGIISKLLFTLLITGILIGAPGCDAESEQEVQRKIITSGNGLVRVSPNMAELNMQIEALNRDGGAAKVDVDQRVNRFLAALQPLEIDETDVVASSLKLNPNYTYQNQKRQFTGYRASRNITLSLHRLDQLNELMDVALKSGIDQIGHIELRVADEQQYQQQAQQQAIADSQQKAAALAKAYGATLGPILQIEYQGSVTHYPEPRFKMEAMSRSSQFDNAAPGKYLHDKIQFNDRINVIFELRVKD